MSLTINHPVGSSVTNGATTLSTTTTTTTTASNTHLTLLRHFHHHNFSSSSLSLSSTSRSSTHIVKATSKFTSRTGKFDSRNKRGGSPTTTKEDSSISVERLKKFESNDVVLDNEAVVDSGSVDDGYFLPDLPGDETDFWEGPQWDAFGFFVQYMWAFGVVFALVACGIAVATYNEGATDFRETPAFKESVQSSDLLEGPDASNSDVFESNPTEEAPALE